MNAPKRKKYFNQFMAIRTNYLIDFSLIHWKLCGKLKTNNNRRKTIQSTTLLHTKMRFAKTRLCTEMSFHVKNVLK